MQTTHNSYEPIERWTSKQPQVLTMMRRISTRDPGAWASGPPTTEQRHEFTTWMRHTYGTDASESYYTFVDPDHLLEV